jgi:hypothetical protein
MQMKETVRSLRLYFILSGLAGALISGSALRVYLQRNAVVEAAIRATSVALSLAFIYVGFRLSGLLRTSPKHVVAVLYVSGSWTVVVFLIDFFSHRHTIRISRSSLGPAHRLVFVEERPKTRSRDSISLASIGFNDCLAVPLSALVRGAKMSNGRSGGFMITRVDLKELVKAIPDDTAVGQMRVEELPIRAASAAEAIRFVDECPHDGVAVEEQDHKFYILHLSNDPILWLLIDSKSPIFPEFQRRHAQWMLEHPGWNGWVAF